MHRILTTMRQRLARAKQDERRGLKKQAGMTLIEIMLVLAILATVLGVLFGPTLLDMFRGSKVKTTKILVDKYAFEAYTRWSLDADDDCPSSIEVLSKVIGREDAKDSYGQKLIMICGDDLPEEAKAAGIGILSKGKDKKQGTKDDIVSWKKVKKE